MPSAQWLTVGNGPTFATSDRIDTVPVDDLVAHDVLGEDCVCGPRVSCVPRPGRCDGWAYLHWSLDGRPTEDLR